MFTGIIESLGKVVDRKEKNGNIEFFLHSEFSSELSINQSISHNGACLSVTSINQDVYSVTVIEETLKKTNLIELMPGDLVNLERSMPASGRFDGHMVLGHVDKVGVCRSVEEMGGSHVFLFEYEKDETCITVEKGSICINGISLTVVSSSLNSFSVAIIPYTFEHTNLRFIKQGSKVNLEFDVLGKYIQKILAYPR